MWGGGNTASWRVSLPPKWVDTVDRCEAHMEALDKKLDVLTGLHTKRLMVSFADDSEAAQERNIEAQVCAGGARRASPNFRCAATTTAAATTANTSSCRCCCLLPLLLPLLLDADADAASGLLRSNNGS